MIVHLKGTRVALPEHQHQRETFKRHFLHMLFGDQFRDDKTYATSFDLEGQSIDLEDPKGIGSVTYRAGLLVTFSWALMLYAGGDYPGAATVLEQVASQNKASDLALLAQRWLILCYLNAKSYEAALRVFDDLEQKGANSNADRIRLGFLRLCRERYVRGVLPNIDSDWVRPLQDACMDTTLPATMKGLCAAMLAEGEMGLAVRDDPFSMGRPQLFTTLRQLLQSAIAEEPRSFFLQYLLAMITRQTAEAEEALRKAEELNLRAAEPHFGRALLRARHFGPETELSALGEIDKAINAEPSETDYWLEKLTLLESLRQSAIGHVAREIRIRQVALREEFLRASWGSTDERAWMFATLAKEYSLLGRPKQATEVLKKLVEEFPARFDLCLLAAREASIDIGAFQEAHDFISCAGRFSDDSPDARKDLNEISAEVAFRRGDFDQAADGYVFGVFRDSWKTDPAESIAVLDVLANICHAAGRLDEAERLLLIAKDRVLKQPYTGYDFRPVSLREFGITLPQNDFKWKWAVMFDLGLLLVTRGQYLAAAKEFEDSVEVLAAFSPRWTKQESRAEKSLRFRGLASLTSTCRGYALFKAGDHDGAARIWRSGTHPDLSVAYANDAERRDEVEKLRHEIETHPYEARSHQERLVSLLTSLKRYREAIEFIEGNELGEESSVALLYLYGVERRFDKVEDVFALFAKMNGGAFAFGRSMATLSSTFYAAGRWGAPFAPSEDCDYFLSVITRDPDPERKPRPDLSTWRDISKDTGAYNKAAESEMGRR